MALIITDPPYPAEYVELWSHLGDFAAKALIEGGSLAAYCGQSVLPDAIGRLERHLRYWWVIAVEHSSGSQMLPGKFVSVGWKPVLWFVRDRRATKSMIPDRSSGMDHPSLMRASTCSRPRRGITGRLLSVGSGDAAAAAPGIV